MNTTTQKTNGQMEIHKSSNYDQFKLLEGNRLINKVHLERLKESMKEKYLISPIIINQKHEIIDGQHRYQAAKDLKLPIFYIVVNNYGLSEVQRFNSNQKNFAYQDFLTGYCDLGFEDYIILREFKAAYGVGWNTAFVLLTGRAEGGKTAEKFRNGDFKIKDLKKADFLAKRLLDFKQFYEGWSRRSFVNAFYRMATNKNYDHRVMQEKLRYLSAKMVDCVNTEDYLKMLEDIYNYKTRSEKVKF